VITQLICHFSLDIKQIEQHFNLTFSDYFAETYPQLDQFVADGLLRYDAKRIEVLPAGHLLIRNICMAFDYYILHKTDKQFSKVI
jgi:oxygen-independent coproporphyrinogen-3 oxidase